MPAQRSQMTDVACPRWGMSVWFFVSRNYGRIAFTDRVNDVQQRYGSREFYARHQARTRGPDGVDALTPEVGQFLADRDGFYVATVNASERWAD